mmetsp:Transcript_55697/g.133278  ORF Transcript_55697/g.133278 Transcript_55697/m.133278 type:complete len:208 (+) Transcript_55697:1317-1940(+)
MAPLSRQICWIHVSIGRSGRSCTPFRISASGGSSEAARSRLTTPCSKLCTNSSLCFRCRSQDSRLGSRSDSRDRSHVKSFVGLGVACAELRPAVFSSKATLAASTAWAACCSWACGSSCWAAGSASKTDRNCEAFRSRVQLLWWCTKMAMATSRLWCSCGDDSICAAPACVCCANSCSMPESCSASSCGDCNILVRTPRSPSSGAAE